MADFPFTLSYSYFGAPGCGGSSKLCISIDDVGNIRVVHDLPSEYDDSDEDDEVAEPHTQSGDISDKRDDKESVYRRSAVVPAHRGWRGVVEYLASNEIVAFFTDGDTRGEYPWPNSMNFEGTGSIASDLIAAAWSGHPLLDIAQALAKLPDAILEALRVRCGSLCSDEVIRPLFRIWNKAQELDVPFDIITGRAHRFDFHLPSMFRDLGALSAVIEAEAQAVAKRRAWMISPYAPTIDHIVAQWRKAHPPTSMNTQIGQSMRAGGLKRFLEVHILEHGRLPSGVQRVEGGPASAFNVDFDGLVPKDQKIRR